MQISEFIFYVLWASCINLSVVTFVILQVTPLTALKFAELTARVGFPKGVVNILPGSGTVSPPTHTQTAILSLWDL